MKLILSLPVCAHENDHQQGDDRQWPVLPPYGHVSAASRRTRLALSTAKIGEGSEGRDKREGRCAIKLRAGKGGSSHSSAKSSAMRFDLRLAMEIHHSAYQAMVVRQF